MSPSIVGAPRRVILGPVFFGAQVVPSWALLSLCAWTVCAAPDEPASPASPASPEIAAPVAPQTLIAGRVRDRDGRPLAGASVCALVLDREVPPQHRQPLCTRTDPAGDYEVHVAPGRSYAVGAAGPRHLDLFPAGAQERSRLVLKEGERRAGVDIVLMPGGVEWAGVVRDPEGRATAGALVRTGVTTVRSGPRGEFSLWAPRGSLRAAIDAPGYASAHVEAIEGAPVEVVLRPGASVSGTVVDGVTGTPLAGVRVEVLDANTLPWDWGRSDERGRFRLERLPAGAHVVQAAAFERRSEPARLELVEGEARELSITLRPARSVRGVVVDDEGTPCGEGSVALEAVEGPARYSAELERGGVFLVPEVDPGLYRPRAHCTDHLAGRTELTIDARTASVDNVRLVVAPGAAVHGRVLTPERQPAWGEAVMLSGPEGSTEQVASAVKSGPDGRFRFTGLASGRYMVIMMGSPDSRHLPSAESLTVTVEQGRAPPDEVTLVARAGGALSGRVVDAAGQPVAQAMVHAWHGQRNAQGSPVKTAADGTFDFLALEPGRYSVEVWASSDQAAAPRRRDRPIASASVDIAVGEDSSLDLTVNPARSEKPPRVGAPRR